MSKEFHHVTVLLHETIDMLDVKPDGIYVDATLGGAGHSEYLLTKLNESGHLYAFDQDQHAIENAKIRLAPFIEKGMVTFIKDNFRHLKERLNELGVTEIDGICYDLGVIEVNDELGAADESIQQAMDLLALDGRISVITFHSLEDRLTKQLFKEASTVEVPKGLPFIPDDLKPKMELVNRKPILPSDEELEDNNRSHSAKLRVARKIHK